MSIVLGRIKKFIVLFMCSFVFVNLIPMKVHADMGPKPSVVIEIEGLEDEVYYGTLLSQRNTNGPIDVMSETELAQKQGEDNYEIWKAFAAYKDKDGYYFLPNIYPCEGTDSFGWGYYPPSPFKVLLYFPRYDTFVVSEIYEEYAFDSYYKIDLMGIDIENATADVVVTASKSYKYGGELVSLLIRIVLTILVELGIARVAGYSEKKQFRLLIIVNVITQVLLNIWLNVVAYRSGSLALMIHYFNLELLIFVIEAFIYATVFPIISEKRVKKLSAVTYAFIANLISFLVGMLLAMVLPVIF